MRRERLRVRLRCTRRCSDSHTLPVPMMNKLRGFFQRLFCRHQSAAFMRNIHGDEINLCGGKRSVWRCTACGVITLRDELHQA